MSQEIKSVGVLSPQGNASLIDSQEDAPKSWWQSVVGFIFAEEEDSQEPAAILENKKITEIDPEVLRKKSRAEEEAQRAATEAAKKTKAKVEKGGAEVVKPVAPSMIKPGSTDIPVNQKMRKAATAALNRLSTRMHTVSKRIEVLEETFVRSQQQIGALNSEITNLNKTYADKKKRRPKATHKLTNLQERVAKLEERLTLVKSSDAEAHRGHQVAQKELVLVKGAMTEAEKVVALLEKSQVDPEVLGKLQKKAAQAEHGLAALKA